ncbi:MAG TPA: hypothetical protein VIQ74_01995 [Gemmatimonadaceae bacterium]
MTNDTDHTAPPLTPDEWRDLDYRPRARDIDAWARGQKESGGDAAHHVSDDATQYVAKIGITPDDCVLIMSRAHEYVTVPPPVRHALAALALFHQPTGFSARDVHALRAAADIVATADPAGDRVAAALAASELRDIALRIEALLER